MANLADSNIEFRMDPRVREDDDQESTAWKVIPDTLLRVREDDEPDSAVPGLRRSGDDGWNALWLVASSYSFGATLRKDSEA